MGKSDSQNLIVKPWSVGFRRPMRKKLSGGLDLTPGLNETLIYVLQFVLRATWICNSGSLAYVFISPNQGRRYPQFLISSVIVYNSFTLPLSLNLLGVNVTLTLKGIPTGMKGPEETLNVGGLSYFPETNKTMEHHLGLQKNKISFQLSLSLVNGWCHSSVPVFLTYFFLRQMNAFILSWFLIKPPVGSGEENK